MSPGKKLVSNRHKYSTIVIKIGSSTLTTPTGKLDHHNLKRIVAEAASLVKQKKKVLLVTSGAIVTGAEKLSLGQPKTIPQKQAAAAIGQALLMRQYEKAFESHGIMVAQVLLTRDVITHSERKLNVKNCLTTLLSRGIVPIINENDAVAVDEIKIGDNDNLAAMTARLIEADLLILLTDVDGFYLKDHRGKLALVQEITSISGKIRAAAGISTSKAGTGGMATKIQAAEICSLSGITMAIASGRKSGVIINLSSGEKEGSIFYPVS